MGSIAGNDLNDQELQEFAALMSRVRESDRPQIVGGNKARSYQVSLIQGSRARITPTDKETTMKEWR